MSNTKILQSILDGQVLIRKDIKEVKEVLTKRIDKLGMQLASLEDDSPTIEEFDLLAKRVNRLEKHRISA